MRHCTFPADWLQWWCGRLPLVCATRLKRKVKSRLDPSLLFRRFEQLDTMTEKEKELAKEILDLVILQHKLKELAGPSAAA